MSTFEKAKSEDSEEDKSISMVEVTEEVIKFLGDRAPGVDEICFEMLKAFDVVGLSWLTCLFIVA